MSPDIFSNTATGSLRDPVSATATGNGTGFDLRTLGPGIGLALIHQSIGVVGGTSPTYTGSIEDSADNSTFAALSPAQAFTQVTASTNRQSMALDLRQVRRYIRHVQTVGGTSPTFLVSVVIVAQKENV